jgi:Holliday junction resolvase RusA-like endonuclease
MATSSSTTAAQPRFNKESRKGMTLKFTIPGKPIGKPRMTRRDKWAQRSAVVKYREWCDRTREIVGPVPPANQTASVSWVAYFEPPKSWSKRKREDAIGELHRSRPDRDNIDKALLDCLWKEDSGIARGTIEKRWGREPRLEITIELN